MSDLSFLEICARNFSFRRNLGIPPRTLYGDEIYNVAYFVSQFLRKITVTTIRRGHIGDNKSLNACKKVKGLEKIWTEETQIPELGKCRLSQRPTKKKIKDLIRSGG